MQFMAIAILVPDCVKSSFLFLLSRRGEYNIQNITLSLWVRWPNPTNQVLENQCSFFQCFLHIPYHLTCLYGQCTSIRGILVHLKGHVLIQSLINWTHKKIHHNNDIHLKMHHSAKVKETGQLWRGGSYSSIWMKLIIKSKYQDICKVEFINTIYKGTDVHSVLW